MSDARSIAFKLMGRNPNDPSMLYGDDVNRMALNNAIQSDANSSVTPDQAKAASEREMNAYRRAQASIDAVGDGSGQAPLVTDPLSPTGRSRMDRANERGAKFFPSAAASLADPFNIPSAIAGAVDNQAFGGGRSTSLEGKTGGPTIANSQDRPNIRDSWRGVEAQSPGGNIVGGVASGGGVFGAAGKVVKSVPGMMAFGTASGGSSDALDQLAGGRDDAVNSTTVAKMLMGGAGPMPRRVLMGAGAAGVVGGGLLASGAVPSFAAGDPLEAYDKQLQDARGRLTNIEQSKAAAEQALAKQWD